MSKQQAMTAKGSFKSPKDKKDPLKQPHLFENAFYLTSTSNLHDLKNDPHLCPTHYKSYRSRDRSLDLPNGLHRIRKDACLNNNQDKFLCKKHASQDTVCSAGDVNGQIKRVLSLTARDVNSVHDYKPLHDQNYSSSQTKKTSKFPNWDPKSESSKSELQIYAVDRNEYKGANQQTQIQPSHTARENSAFALGRKPSYVRYFQGDRGDTSNQIIRNNEIFPHCAEVKSTNFINLDDTNTDLGSLYFCSVPQRSSSVISQDPFGILSDDIPTSRTHRKLSDESSSIRSGEFFLQKDNLRSRFSQMSSFSVEPRGISASKSVSTFLGHHVDFNLKEKDLGSPDGSESTLNNSPEIKSDSVTDSGISCNISEQCSPNRTPKALPTKSGHTFANSFKDSDLIDQLSDDGILEMIISEAETKATLSRRPNRQSLPPNHSSLHYQRSFSAFPKPPTRFESFSRQSLNNYDNWNVGTSSTARRPLSVHNTERTSIAFCAQHQNRTKPTSFANQHQPTTSMENDFSQFSWSNLSGISPLASNNLSSSLCFNCDFCKERRKKKNISKYLKIQQSSLQTSPKLVFLISFTKEYLQIASKVQKLRSKYPSCDLFKCASAPKEVLYAVTKELVRSQTAIQVSGNPESKKDESIVFRSTKVAINPTYFSIQYSKHGLDNAQKMPLDTFCLIEVMPDERKLSSRHLKSSFNISSIQFSAASPTDCFPLIVYDHLFPNIQNHFVQGMTVNSHTLLVKAVCSIVFRRIQQQYVMETNAPVSLQY